MTDDGELEQLKATLSEERLNHIDTMVGRIDATRSDRALMRRLYTAWWSARIGRAEERAQVHDALRSLWETNQQMLDWQGRAILAEEANGKLREDIREARLGWSRIDIDNTNLIVRNEAAIQHWAALTKKIYTAWWSARIGRAKARQEAADLRTALSLVGGGLNFVGDHAERVTAQRDQLMTLVRALIDPDDCWFDHNPSCQAHDYLNVKAGEKCPQAGAKELLATIDKTKAPGT